MISKQNFTEPEVAVYIVNVVYVYVGTVSDGGDGDKKFQKITYLLTDHGDCLIILRLFTYRKVLIQYIIYEIY